jgi:hypothetical protein
VALTGCRTPCSAIDAAGTPGSDDAASRAVSPAEAEARTGLCDMGSVVGTAPRLGATVSMGTSGCRIATWAGTLPALSIV